MSRTYAKDRYGNEFYKKDASGNDVIVSHRYAVKWTGEAFYPRNFYGDEFHYKDQYIQLNGNYILPKDKDGFPQYPTNAEKNEYYLFLNDTYVIGLDKDGNQHYAKAKNGEELYTPHAVYGRNNDSTTNSKFFAKTADGTIKYAKNKHLRTKFPKDKQGNEFYLQIVNLENPDTIPSLYAKDKDGNDFYPKRLTRDNFESDVLVRDSYAKNKLQEYFYPKDAFNNEFYLSTPEFKLPTKFNNVIQDSNPRYAVTNDLKIIVPKIMHHPEFDLSVKPFFKIQDIIGNLIREGTDSSDFLTNQEYSHLPKPTAQEYRYFDINNPDLIITISPLKIPSFSILKWFMNKWYIWVWFPILLFFLFVKSIS